MSKLPTGNYHTEAGSTLRVSGSYAGIFEAQFDWLEEKACIECRADAEPIEGGDGFYMMWNCDECGGGMAKLFADVEELAE